jgi:NitT/TauT family transport system substrate-binding protein
MSSSRRRFLLGSAAAMALTLRPRAGRTAPAKLTEVTLLFPRLTPGPDYSFLWAADALGYFAEEGLKVSVQPTNGSPEVARLVAAGQGDFGFPGAEATIISVAKGLPVIDVFCIQQRMVYSLGAPQASAINTVADLKGKRIGVQSLTASPVFVAKALLRGVGLDPERDVTFVPVGIGAQAVAAVKSGQVDAAAFHDTQFLQFAMSEVPFRLFPMPAFAKHFTAGIVVKSDMVAARPEMVTGFGRAIAKGLVYSFANPEASIKAMAQVVPGTGVKNPAEALAELKQRLTYEELPPEAKGQWGWNTTERYGRFADFLLDAGVVDRKVDGGKLFDGRFLEAINAFDVDGIVRAAKSA